MAIEFKEDRIIFGNLLSVGREIGSDEPYSIPTPAEVPKQKNTAGDCAEYSYIDVHDKMKEDGSNVRTIFGKGSPEK